MKKVLSILSGKGKKGRRGNANHEHWVPPFAVGVHADYMKSPKDPIMPPVYKMKLSKETRGSAFKGLDPGVWTLVFSYLPMHAFATVVPLVCKHWRELAYSDSACSAWARANDVPGYAGAAVRKQLIRGYSVRFFPRGVYIPPDMRKLNLSAPPVDELPSSVNIRVIGAFSGAGTCKALIRYVTGHFLKEYDPYIEDSYRKQIGGCLVEFMIMAAQEEYTAMRDQFFRVADLLWIGQDFSRGSEGIDEINTLVEQYLRVKDKSWLPVIVMRTKADSKFDDHRMESAWPMVRLYLNTIQVPLAPVSAMEGTGLDALMELSLAMIMWHRRSRGISSLE